MRVIQLDDEAVIKRDERTTGIEVQTDDVLERTADEKVLLFEAQPLAPREIIVRVQDLREVFRDDLLFDRAVIVAHVERGEVERFRRFRLPEPQHIDRGHTVANDGRVMRDAAYDMRGDP